MFYFARAFNGDLSTWDVSSIADLSGMFSGASSFNGDLGTWDVSSVTNMRWMSFWPVFFLTFFVGTGTRP
jgi:surface protein